MNHLLTLGVPKRCNKGLHSAHNSLVLSPQNLSSYMMALLMFSCFYSLICIMKAVLIFVPNEFKAERA